MAGPEARRWLIDGRVQGVGYRMWLQAEAGTAGVSGWVRNLSDGRVEALLRGSPEVLDRLEILARTGPAHARVDQVAATPWPDPVPGGRFRQVADAATPERSRACQPGSGTPVSGTPVSGTDDT